MPGIQVQNITKSWSSDGTSSPTAPAVNQVSFQADPGQVFGIIGPDGAGKTTLFRILTTLLLPDSGTATVDDLDVLTQVHEIRQRVGYMPGKFSLYQDLTVEENLAFYASVFGSSISENYHLIKDIYQQIEPFRKRKAGALSGGMKQKLALSCALIHKPAVLFLDEPTTGVDAVSRQELWEMLLKLKEQGLCILVSTPYMDEASMCDQIALMLRGRFLAQDTPAGIIGQYDRRLLAVRSDRMPALLRDLRSIPGVLTCHAFGDSHHITVTDQLDTGAMANTLTAAGHKQLDISPATPGIEDCFLLLSESNSQEEEPA